MTDLVTRTAVVKPAAKTAGRTTRPRRTSAGDVAPTQKAAQLERYVVEEKIQARQASTGAAMQDILQQIPQGDTQALIKTLGTMMSGLSPDDAVVLRNALLSQENELLFHQRPLHPDDQLAPDWRKGGYPYKNLLSRRSYEREKYRLQVELLKLQAWVKETGQKVVILFEGRDAAGKGGSIKRFMEHLNPRGARIVALEKPSESERGQWYFQRYVQHLPTAGEIVMFDRSW